MTPQEANIIVAKYDGWVDNAISPSSIGATHWYHQERDIRQVSAPSYISLDVLIRIWLKLDVEYSQFYPQSYPKIWFKIGKHISQDETKTWIGKGDNLKEAALLATALMIEELINGS